ncbi:MAG: hypothetical protein M3137_04310 [Actinomycetota bacterium]|nr:hypothetical protein [Actinomycetota bacterium]
MARLLDTSPTFEAFARKAFLESPIVREQLWEEDYEQVHPEVFEGFYAKAPSGDGRQTLVRELSQVRKLAAIAAPITAELINDVEPVVADLLGVTGGPLPRHVLMVGSMSASAVVGRLEGEVALFHCLEWFSTAEGARVLIAHEDAHALHEIALVEPAPTDAAWTAFYEGLAIQTSRAAVVGRSEEDYFWYGYAGFEQWLPWCRDNRELLMERFSHALDDPEAAETFFGAGLVEGHWRTGFFLADALVGGLGATLAELVAMSPAEGRAAIRDVLGPR